jgi:glycosyltransferase involved in cell wall biosynthesis
MGGFERHVGALVRHLVREGVEVDLYTAPARDEAKGLDGARIHFVPYRILPWPRRAGFVIADRCTNYLFWSVRAARRLLTQPVDIVQAEGGAAFGYALLRPTGGAPLVLHPVGMEEFKAGWLKRTAYLPLRSAVRYAARRAERVLIPDRAMMEEVRHYLSIRPEQAAMLSTPIDLERVDQPVPASVREEILRRWRLDGAKTVILSVGRLELNKGFSVLIEALHQVRDKLPANWVWVLVGSGPAKSRLRKELQRTGLSDRARLVGSVSDDELSSLYQRADLFVHPTLYEGSSLVTLEAMAHSKPVVASSAGGIRDKVRDGRSGFLVPPGDAEALANAVLRALSMGSSLAPFGQEGRRVVEAEFSWAQRIPKLLEIYREILSERRS